MKSFDRVFHRFLSLRQHANVQTKGTRARIQKKRFCEGFECNNQAVYTVANCQNMAMVHSLRTWIVYSTSQLQHMQNVSTIRLVWRNGVKLDYPHRVVNVVRIARPMRQLRVIWDYWMEKEKVSWGWQTKKRETRLAADFIIIVTYVLPSLRSATYYVRRSQIIWLQLHFNDSQRN